MSRGRILTLPFVGFAITLVAAATLQPVVGSFSKAYRFDGGAQIVAASDGATATPVRGVYPITVTPTPPRQAVVEPTSLSRAEISPAPSSTPERATGTPAPSGTRAPTRTASATATATQTASATSTPTATATLTPTATATPSPTPDPCGSPRDARLVLSPATQTLLGSNVVRGQLSLSNQGRHGWGRDLVLSARTAAGDRYLTGLHIRVGDLDQAAAAGAGLTIGDLAPGESLTIAFEASVAWNAVSLSTANGRPSVDLRFEVMAGSCGVASSSAPAAAAQVVIAPGPVVVPVKPITAIEAEAALDSVR